MDDPRSDPDVGRTVPKPTMPPDGPSMDGDETIVTDYRVDTLSGTTAGGARYEFVREIARGGMGVILQTRDQQLGREIACKLLLPEHAGSAELVQRFIEESQIASQLQHPGIVPVYDAGRLPDDRPYFTMRLVKGQTLTAILRERSTPAQDLLRFLGIFEKICETLAYAHARGVIHRDLKPSNVMVGRYGELQVMDWGLAKVCEHRGNSPQLSTAPAAEVSIVHSPRSRDSNSGSGSGAETSAGSILGTVSYMAPEQARGEIDQLDKRTDVFGLGAILCEILTGKPPYAGVDNKQLYHRAACGDLRDAFERLDGSGNDPELVELGKRCLSVAPSDRPADAGDVARAIRTYLEGTQERLRHAQLERAAAEARAEEAKATAAVERRARRLTGGLAAAVLLLGMLGITMWRWRDQARVRHERELAAQRAEQIMRDQRAALILQESITLQEQEQWSAALASARRAADLLNQDSDAQLRARITRQTTDLQLLDSLERARIDSLGVDVKASRISHEGLPEKFAAAFHEAGLDLKSLRPEAATARLNESAIRDRLVALLWFWMNTDSSAETRDELRTLLRAVDQTSPARRASDALDAQNSQLLRDLVELTDYTVVSCDMAWVVSTLLSRQDRNLSRDWLSRAQRVHPADFWINFNLGHHLMQQGRTAEAIGYFRVALAAHPRHAGVMLNLGLSHLRQQALPEAELFYREAIRAQPDYPSPHVGLGDALQQQGRHAEAVEVYRTALRLLGDHRNATWENAAIGLGGALQELRDPTACQVLQELVAHNPRNASGWLGLARIHFQSESWAECQLACRKTLEINSRDAQAQALLASVLLRQKRYAEAEAAFRVAREFLGDDRQPGSENVSRGLMDALAAQGKAEEAERIQRDVRSPEESGIASLLKQADDRRKRKDWSEAEQCYRKALVLAPDSIQAHTGLGEALANQSQFTEAAAEYRAALELLGKDRGALWQLAAYGLAGILNRQGDYEGSIRLLVPLVEVSPRHLGARYRLGDAYRRQRNWKAAAEHFRVMIEISPHIPAPHVDLASALLGQEMNSAAESEYRTALDLAAAKRDAVWERACVGLAVAAAAQGRPDEALEELTRSVAEAPVALTGKMMLVHYHGYRRDWAGVGRELLAATDLVTDHASIYAMQAAGAFLLAGDVDGYRRVCSTMLDRYGETNDPSEADRTVKACCLSRHFDGDLARVRRLADIAVNGQEQQSWYVYFALSRSLAALRGGDWQDALSWSRICRERGPTFAITATPAWLVDALALHRLGRADESREALAAADEMRTAHAAAAEEPLQDTWGEWLLFDALRADIEQMLAE